FMPHPQRPRRLLLGGGVGIPPMVFLAERLLDAGEAAVKPLVLMGSEVPFPFRTRPSTLIVPGIPAGTIACMPLLEEWGVPSRLASRADFPGCFPGMVTELADAWLASLGPAELEQVEIFCCGPTAMLEASAQRAACSRPRAVGCGSRSALPGRGHARKRFAQPDGQISRRPKARRPPASLMRQRSA